MSIVATRRLLSRYNHHVLTILVVMSATLAHAQDAKTFLAQPYSINGAVTLKRSDSKNWVAVQPSDQFRSGDTVRTGADGTIAFKFVDGTLVRLGRLSVLTFRETLPSGSPVVSQTAGKGYYFSRGAHNEPEIHTPLVNAAIYGTELVVDIEADKTTIDILHGSVKASNQVSEVQLTPGEQVIARKGAPLQKAILVQSGESVQWMIRFPFILVESDLLAPHDPECVTTCQRSITDIMARVRAGQPLLAAYDQQDARFKQSPRGSVIHALALWLVGDAASARSILASLPTTLSPASEALRDVANGFNALITGDLEQSRAQLRAAEALRSDMVNTKLLESYIDQAAGEISEALRVIQTSRSEFPAIPELMDREAELLLSSDDGRAALQLLTQRIQTYGKNATTSSLIGFAALSRKEFDLAGSSFHDAIAQDPSQSLPYLGEALLSVQHRDYSAAKDLLSKAVQLEPANATYRSYLGKLFFEDEQTPKSLEEFNAAIALDPKDPSPYLYRSFARVANNEPIRALEDVEQSIQLNDGRAVYRSRLLLDRDLGVRSAGLSRVFTELGFSEAARVEAIKSIGDDYTNFSAHRLLGDSYTSILDGEANLSEKRIADLLSPLSFNLFNSLGEQASLGDYNALFDKKETRKAVRLDWNSNQDQIGGEFLASGKGEDFGYLLTYQPFYMSGSHHKAFLGENTLRGALQYEPTPDDRFIIDGTFKMRNSEGSNQGDYSEDVNIGSLRLGLNHRFSSSLRFLTQAEFGRDREYTSLNTDRDVSLQIPSEQEAFTTDVIARESSRQRVLRNSLSSQMIYNSTYLDSVAGIEGMYVDTSRREFSPVLGFNQFPDTPVTGDLVTNSAGSLTSGQAYEYLTLKVPRTASLTLGLAGTSVERDLTEVAPFKNGEDRESALTPKVGLVLTPANWLTARAAYFESLSRKSVLEDLSSLEPTLVGGLNQRFNDLSGTYSRNLGFGVDVKDANTLYAGAQYIRRHIRESFGVVDDIGTYDGQTIASLPPASQGFQDVHADSDIFRGYVYSVLSTNSVLTADTLDQWYQDTDPELRNSINTQRHRLGYKYFLGKHLSLGAQATYRDQSWSNGDSPNGFWLFDTSVSYRFAEQRGRVFARIDNILDRDFTYDQSVGLEPRVFEGRSFIVGVAYNFW